MQAARAKVNRRDFLKLMAASGVAMTFAPFVEWGRYLPNPPSVPDGRQYPQVALGVCLKVEPRKHV